MELSYSQLCSYKNLELAFKKARKHKTLKFYVINFEKNLKENLLQLQSELVFHTYQPKSLETFILRDPKTRKISKSDFRDRIVHHALCNIIEPIFEKSFIYDSYANRKGKGTLKAVERFDHFLRKVSKCNTQTAFVFKADIKQYFEAVDHKILLEIIKEKIKDERILWLIKKILQNYKTKIESKSMPLGNLTSQFFANVYLGKLDQFIKHKLRAKYYLRYVDDFVILHQSKKKLEKYKERTGEFLEKSLALRLHPDKSRIFPLLQGTDFLGFRIFPHYKLIKRKNLRKFKKKFNLLCLYYNKKLIDYDKIYDFVESWCAYAKYANTYKLRKNVLNCLEIKFGQEIPAKEMKLYYSSNF